MMNARRLIEELGGPTKVASQIPSPRRPGKTLTAAAVSKWDKLVPSEHVGTIVRLSNGKYQPHQIRRDLFPRPSK